jgi:AcrR family transcriptional regulator
MSGNYRSPRRAEAAADTRASIVNSARSLFTERGYAAVTVADIAEKARVAVPTVYSSTGGKADVLAAILDPLVNSGDAADTLERVGSTDDPRAVIDAVGEGTRLAHEKHWDLLPALVDVCRAEPAAAAVLDRGVTEYLRVLAIVADRLAELGALRPEIDHAAAVDLLWFHLGQDAWLTLVGRRGWSFNRAQTWLTQSARGALLVSP